MADPFARTGGEPVNHSRTLEQETMMDAREPEWQTQLQIESIAQGFEKQIRASDPSASIEATLAAHPTLAKTELFAALLESELDARHRDKSHFKRDREHYLARFPDLQSVVRKVFARQRNRETSGDGRSTKDIDVTRNNVTLNDIRNDSVQSTEPPDVLTPDDVVGGYRIVRRIGAGSAGIVYLAVEEATGTEVAIKILRRDWPVALGLRFDRVFREEATVLCALRHPGIVQWIESGEHDGLPYHVMQYIEGSSLGDLLSRCPMPDHEAARIVAAIAGAVHHAHRQGVVHRDLKPGNILLEHGGKVFVSDFGMALVYERLGRGRGFVGTPLYMSPEQARGQSQLLDGRSDVFSLGVILYELLTGTLPFGSRYDTPLELAESIETASTPPLRQRASVPRELETICLKALARDPAQRYQTAEDFSAALDRYLRGPKPTKRIAVASCGILLAFVASFFFWPTAGAPQPRDLPQTAVRKSEERATSDAVHEQPDNIPSEQIKQMRSSAQLIAGQLRTPSSATDVWDAFRFNTDPTLQSILVQAMAEQGVPVSVLLEKFLASTDQELRRTLVLCMAEYKPTDVASPDREAVKHAIAEAFQTDASSGVHSACELLLRRWQIGPDRETMNRLSRTHADADREWYHTIAGQTMIVFSDPLRDSSFPRDRFPVGHRFAIASKELSVRQWRWLENHRQAFNDDDVGLSFPKNYLSWHDAALACNRLTDICGYPASERCYEQCILADGREGYRAVDDILQRRGFRMPTEEEWVYASHTGVSTRRYFGSDDSLLSRYANCRPASNDKLDGVGKRLPNRFGLFDTLGNVSEWTLDPHGDTNEGRAVPPTRYVIVGGSAFTPESGVYPDMDYHYPAGHAGYRVGLRVAQSLPAVAENSLPFKLAVDSPQRMSLSSRETSEGPMLHMIGGTVEQNRTVTVDFGTLPRGCEVRQTFSFFNDGDEDLAVEILKTEGNIHVHQRETLDAIPPGAFGAIQVEVDTDTERHLEGLITVGSNDPLRPKLLIQLRGEVRQLDRYATLGVFREGEWLMDQNRDGTTDSQFTFGQSGDIALAGDFDADGQCDACICRVGSDGSLYWRFRLSSEDPSIPGELQFGVSGDIPMAFDRNGDGRCDIAVVRYSAASGQFEWQIDTDLDGIINERLTTVGRPSDIPVAGDWDGSGVFEPGLYRPGGDPSGVSMWLLSKEGRFVQPAVFFGLQNDVPIVGDWNGDGQTDIGVCRDLPDGRIMYLDLNRDREPELELRFGLPGDQPVIAWGSFP